MTGHMLSSIHALQQSLLFAHKNKCATASHAENLHADIRCICRKCHRGILGVAKKLQLRHFDSPAVAQICAVKLLSQAGNKWQAQARPCATRTSACTILLLGVLAHPPNHLSARTPVLNDKVIHICSTLAYWWCVSIHAQGRGAVLDGCMCHCMLIMLDFRMTLPDRHRDSHNMVALPRCKMFICQRLREACHDVCWMT